MRERNRHFETLRLSASDAWVFTNGYNVGIVQLVGKAIHKSKLTNPQKKIIAIALCKWGCIKNRANLIETNDQTNQVCRKRGYLDVQELTFC